ncbi:MAG: hypothetical protein R3352_09845, partial [Salinisphaeraceae bacterium]|nr:hypothetical protein [Salinisphaeraceae bacterium]
MRKGLQITHALYCAPALSTISRLPKLSFGQILDFIAANHFMRLIVIGLNHRTAPLALREAVAFGSEQLPSALQSLKALPNVGEAALLSTCNRTEIYALATAQGDEQISSWLQSHAGEQTKELPQHLYNHKERDAV